MRPATAERGFTYLEVLISSVLLALCLLAMCGMFITGFSHVTSAGRSTVGVAAARQMLEDVRILPFDTITELDGFDTDNPGTQPAADPARELARRWRYALAGEGGGWTFTDQERTRWTDLDDDDGQIRGAGTISVADQSATLRQVTVTVAVPGRFRPVVLTTLVARI